jgi:hypothetical protein
MALPFSTTRSSIEFETSSSYMDALAKALSKLGQLPAVVSNMGSPLRSKCLTEPYANRWWGTAETEAVVASMSKTGGHQLIREAGRMAVFESISVIIKPLISVILAVSSSSPAAIFSRYKQFADSSVRNIGFDYEVLGERSGVLVLTYPSDTSVDFLPFWLGSVDFVFDVTKKTPEKVEARQERRKLLFAVSWKP